MFKINNRLGLLLLIMAFCCRAAESEAQGMYLSVKQFGAKGDGTTDDTEAIIKAIKASQDAIISTNSIKGVYELQGNSIYVGGSKAVFFPLGMYKISKPIAVGSYTHLIGEKAILIPSDKNLSVGILSSSWQGHFEGLQFVGFKTAIKIDNKNLDCGKIEIEDCDFVGNGTAIELNAVSSLCTIKESRFFRNDKALDLTGGDKVIMADNWITAGTLKGKQDCQITNRGVLHFERNMLVPIPPAAGAVEPAWINNYGNLLIDGVRQGGELGSFTLVNNFTQASTNYPIWPNVVSIRNSDCYAVYGNSAAYTQPAALRLIGIPNSIVLEDLRGFVDAKVMDFSQISQKESTARLRGVTTNLFSIRVSNIHGARMKFSNGTDVPDNLKQYEIK